jgi:SAM-dependent methyltransferase
MDAASSTSPTSGFAFEAATECILCGSRDSRHVFAIPPLGFVRCFRCRLVRTSPRIASADVPRYYAQAYDYASREQSLAEQLANPTFGFRASRLGRFAHGRRFFEVGCGDGNFLAVLQNSGWSVRGCETSVAGAQAARQRHGLDIDIAAFDELHIDGAYDAIGAYHVLEHLYDPRPTLSAIASALRPGGIVHLQWPNIRCLDALLAGRHWWGLGPPQHVHFYEPRHMRALLRKFDMDIVSIETFDPFHSPLSFEFTVRTWARDLIQGVGPAAFPEVPASAHTSTPAAQNGQTAQLKFRPRALAYSALHALSGVSARAEAAVGLGNIADVIAVRR